MTQLSLAVADCSLCCPSWLRMYAHTGCVEWITLDPALLVELSISPCLLELLFLSSVTGLFEESPFLNKSWRERVMLN